MELLLRPCRESSLDAVVLRCIKARSSKVPARASLIGLTPTFLELCVHFSLQPLGKPQQVQDMVQNGAVLEDECHKGAKCCTSGLRVLSLLPKKSGAEGRGMRGTLPPLLQSCSTCAAANQWHEERAPSFPVGSS